MNRFRLAYLFRIPLCELDQRLPVWEQYAWEAFFDCVGPLDWRREDLRDARRIASKCAKEGEKIEDYNLFTEIKRIKTQRELEQDITGERPWL